MMLVLGVPKFELNKQPIGDYFFSASRENIGTLPYGMSFVQLFHWLVVLFPFLRVPTIPTIQPMVCNFGGDEQPKP